MTTTPRRIQRRRLPGWTTPLDAQGRKAIYVGRGTPYGNPYRIVREGRLWIVRVDPADGVTGRTIGDYAIERQARQVAVDHHEAMFRTPGGAEQLHHFAERLHGRDLMCWCPLEDDDHNPVPCHVDTLLRLSNPQRATTDGDHQ